MSQATPDSTFSVVEADLDQIRQALDAGEITCVELVAEYLNRIGYFDRHGIRLNSTPVLDPEVFSAAAASDLRRTRGATLGPLDGIPYTAKASYKVRGLPVSSGSPAFADLIANEDAFAIERLRAAGAVLIGLTNMCPMASGGMQRGLYGRAESPYNPNFLAAAYGSGSSNGSGVATAASLAAFGLGEETWSSGRAPASNNGLVAYTPSRGVISMRGNWPLFPTMDVVVPHTRTVADMLEVLNQVVADDPRTSGDFWRTQSAVDLPKASDVRPEDYRLLADADALRGKRLGVPRMYINKDPDNTISIATRRSIIELWESARESLEALGAEVVEVDFPAVSNYDEDRPGAQSMVTRGIVPREFDDVEVGPLVGIVWSDFLRMNGQDGLDSFEKVDPARMFPRPGGALPDPYDESRSTGSIARWASANHLDLEDVPGLRAGLAGFEETRKVDFEQWLDAQGLDAVVFPANADVAPHDSEFNPVSAEIAWRDGVRFSNGSGAIRHLGIPTVTVPMGVMSDTRMPVGLTFAGRAYADSAVLSLGYAFEHGSPRRMPPPRTPELPHRGSPAELEVLRSPAARNASAPRIDADVEISPQDDSGHVLVTVRGSAHGASDLDRVEVSVNGTPVGVTFVGQAEFEASVRLRSLDLACLHSHWRGPYGALVVVTARDTSGAASGFFASAGGI